MYQYFIYKMSPNYVNIYNKLNQAMYSLVQRGHRPQRVTLLLALMSLLTLTHCSHTNSPPRPTIHPTTPYNQARDYGPSYLPAKGSYSFIRHNPPSSTLEKECISAIKDGQLTRAWLKFYYLKDASRLGTIIKESFSGNIYNFLDVLKFARGVKYASFPPRLDKRLSYEAYVHLYEQMQADSQLDTPQIVNLFYTIKQETDPLDSTLSDLDELKTKLQLIVIELEPKVRSFILEAANNISKGVTFNVLFELDNNELISIIIKEAYSNNVNHFYNVMEFIRGLTHFYQISVAYPELYEQMRQNKHLNSSVQVLLLDYKLKEALDELAANEDEITFKNKLQNLKGKLTPHTKHCKSLIASDVRDGTFDKIIALAFHDSAAFEHYVPELVRMAYVDRASAQLILDLVRRMPWIESSGVIMASLIHEMSKHDHWSGMDALRNELDRVLSMTNYHLIPQHYKHKYFETLKSNL